MENPAIKEQEMYRIFEFEIFIIFFLIVPIIIQDILFSPDIQMSDHFL